MSRGDAEVLPTHRRFFVPWLYLFPFLIGLAVFTAYPIINIFLIATREELPAAHRRARRPRRRQLLVDLS